MVKKKEEGYGTGNDFVSFTLIRQYRAMAYVRQMFNSQTEDGSDIDDEDIVNLIRNKRLEQAGSVRRTMPNAKKIADTDIESRMAAYAVKYDLDDLMPNDIMLLEQLIRNELTIPLIDSEMDNLRGEINKDAHETYGKLNKEKDDLIRRNLDIQKTLAIGRTFRLENKEKSKTEDDIQESVKAASEFVEKEIVTVNCPRCHTHDNWLYTIFRTQLPWFFVQQCGCGVVLLVSKGNETPLVIKEDIFRALTNVLMDTKTNVDELLKTPQPFI